MTKKVSFIIPALNEEKRIGILINSIKTLHENYDYEIIVADGYSTDKTREIAEKMGAVVISDNLDSPKTIANGRNTGASMATGDIFIFCDADTVIKDPDIFLAKVLLVLENPKIIGGTPKLIISPEESNFRDKIFHNFFNKLIYFSFLTGMPICGGQCQIVRRSSFMAVNGYNVDIVHAEDTEFFRRLRKTGKLYFFSELVVYESPRRYRKVGYIFLLMLGMVSLAYQQIFNRNLIKEWKRIES
jgi:glycosyltransferase involved in cell wall biosynthesis